MTKFGTFDCTPSRPSAMNVMLITAGCIGRFSWTTMPVALAFRRSCRFMLMVREWSGRRAGLQRLDIHDPKVSRHVVHLDQSSGHTAGSRSAHGDEVGVRGGREPAHGC